MERKEILATIQDIMKDVFDTEQIQVTDSTVAADVPEWDSLNNIQLVVEIEKRFKVKFTSQEIQNFQNVGEMVTSIANKLK